MLGHGLDNKGPRAQRRWEVLDRWPVFLFAARGIWFSARASMVAQICILRGDENAWRQDCGEVRRMQFCDTADCKSALRKQALNTYALAPCPEQAIAPGSGWS